MDLLASIDIFNKTCTHAHTHTNIKKTREVTTKSKTKKANL